MSLYQDTTEGGQWHYCHACKKKGDNLELTAFVRNTSLEEATSWLMRQGILDPSAAEHYTAYEHWYVQRRAWTDRLWAEAQEYLPNAGPSTAAFRQYLDISLTARLERGGQYAGAVPYETLMAYVAPNKWLRGNRGVWAAGEDAGLLAFEDLPGRIAAFNLCRSGRWDEDVEVHYRHAFHAQKGKTIPQDQPGVCMLENAFLPPGGFGDSLFVFMNPLLAVKTQARQLADSSRRLPLVACWPQAKPAAILRQHAPKRDLIVWGEQADADLFRHAKALDARVVTQDERTEELSHLLRRHDKPESWLALLRQRAVSWQEAVYARLKTLPLMSAEHLLSSLGFDLNELKLFLNKAPDGVRARLGRLHSPLDTARQVVVSNKVIHESEEGWLDGRDVLCEVVICLDTVFCRASTGDRWFQGRLRYKGKELQFTASQQEFENNPFQYACTKVLQAGLGYAKWRQHYKSTALEIIQAFRQPKVVLLTERYGWDASKELFVLPNYTLDTRGRVRPNDEPKFLGDDLGVSRLQLPLVMPAEDLNGLFVSSPLAGVFAGLFVSVVRSVLAPFYGYKPSGLLLHGRGTHRLGTLAKALGCVRASPTSPDGLNKVAGTSDWPVFVEGVANNQPWSDWLSGTQNAVASASTLAARVAHVNGYWLLAEVPAGEDPRPDMLDAAARLLPDFLQHFMSGGAVTGLWGVSPLERVVCVVQEYLRERGCGLTSLEELLAPLREAEPARSLGQLLAQFFDEGTVRAVVEKEGTWVSKVELNEQLRKRKLPLIEPRKASEHLRTAGVLLQEEDRNDEPGWRVETAWWAGQVKQWRGGPSLRLVT